MTQKAPEAEVSGAVLWEALKVHGQRLFSLEKRQRKANKKIQGYRERQKGLHSGRIVPGLPFLFREVFMVIRIEHLPKGRAEDMLGVQDGDTKGVGIYNLVGIIVNADFAADALDNDEPRENTFLDNIKVLSKATQGYIHIFMRLAENIHRNTIMTVKLKEVNSIGGEGFILTGIELHAGLINDEFPVLDEILAQIFPGIHLIGAGNGNIGINTDGAFPVFTIYNPVGKTAGKTAAEADHNALTLSLFSKISGKSSLAGAGHAKIDG